MTLNNKIIFKRDGTEVIFDINHLTSFVKTLTKDFDQNWVDIPNIVNKVYNSMINNSSKDQLFDLIAETAAYNTIHHHYGLLAGRIMVKKL